MRISIPYDRTHLSTELPDADISGVLTIKHAEFEAPPGEEIVAAAMAATIGSPALKALSRGKKCGLIIASDHTRPVPSKVIMPLLLKELREGNPDIEIVILIATGFHRGTTRDELIEKFGEDIVRNEDIRIHDSRNNAAMCFKGLLPSGTELWLNSLVDWADLIVAEGFIEPHFFAGFSGGRKSILPGIASGKTVLGNHCSAFIAHDKARTGILEGNPIHRDMLDAARKAKLAYIVNVVLDGDKNITAAFAGDAIAAHEAGCRMVYGMFKEKPVQADIVITSNGGYPLDQDIYQNVKCMTAAEACVKPGGVIIACNSCKNGHGGEAFYRWFADAENAEQVAERIRSIPREETLPDQWEAQILARVLMKADVIMVCDPGMKELVRDMKMLYAATLDEALDMARGMAKGHSITVIPDGIGVIVGA